MNLIISASILLFALGVLESVQHQINLMKIPLRINVSGIRGKSTVTRLITAILAEAGYVTLGKTTGTEARLIIGTSEREEPIARNPAGANINEQKQITRRAVASGAQALVCECMAVHPDYQEVFQKRWLQANIGVITNVLPDHLEEMGPDMEHVAQALAAAIPTGGTIVVAPGPYEAYFRKIARQRNTRLMVADPGLVSQQYLDRFDYIIFPENVALALCVAQALNIDRKTALRGMLKARPDPGALRILPIGSGHRRAVYFANAFSANDPASTLAIWNHLRQLGYSQKHVLVILNCRGDRVERTRQLVAEVLPQLPSHTLALLGEGMAAVQAEYRKGFLPVARLLNWEGLSHDLLVQEVKKESQCHDFVFGMGNSHGAGEQVKSIMEALATEYAELRKELHVRRGVEAGS